MTFKRTFLFMFIILAGILISAYFFILGCISYHEGNFIGYICLFIASALCLLGTAFLIALYEHPLENQERIL